MIFQYAKTIFDSWYAPLRCLDLKIFSSGLELSHFIAEETKNLLSVHPVYDLIGVICHKGCMGIGHYTCMVRCFSQQGQPDIGMNISHNLTFLISSRFCPMLYIVQHY